MTRLSCPPRGLSSAQTAWTRDSGALKNVFWNDKLIGQITARRENLSCVCKIHKKCRTPASTKYETDAVLEEWLLAALRNNGTERLNVARHQELAGALKARVARPKATPKATASSSR